MVFLGRYKEVYQKDLEELFNMRRSTISGILKNMEKNNLIERIDSPKDARIKQIILTESSKKIGNTIKKQRDIYEKKLKQNISNDDLEIFYKVIDQIKENISKISYCLIPSSPSKKRNTKYKGKNNENKIISKTYVRQMQGY